MIRIYLNVLNPVEVEQFEDDKGARKYRDLVSGLELSNSAEGFYYWTVADVNDIQIDPSMEPRVIRITYRDTFHGPSRLSGVYEHETAKATVTRGNDGPHVFCGQATILDDLRVLYNMVRAGTITPQESWEKDQVSKSLGDGMWQRIKKRWPGRRAKYHRQLTTAADN